MKRLFPFIAAYCFSGGAAAIDSITLDISELAGSNWRLNDVRLAYMGLAESRQRLVLRAGSMSLPPPFDHIKFLNFECSSARLRGDAIVCDRGTAQLKAEWLKRSPMKLSFVISPSEGKLHLADIAIFDGRAAIDVEVKQAGWRISYRAKNLGIGRLRALSKQHAFSGFEGRLDARGEAYGRGSLVDAARVRFSATQAAFHNEDGTIAGENIEIRGDIKAERQHAGAFGIDVEMAFREGALYAAPILVEAAGKPIELSAAMVWDRASEILTITKLTYAHPGHGEARAQGVAHLAAKQPLRKLELALEIPNLGALYSTYVAPFFAASGLDGMAMDGELMGNAVFEDGGLAEVQARFSRLSVDDQQARVEVRGGAGTVEWFRDRPAGVSSVSWDSAKLYAVPMGGARVRFQAKPGMVRLLENVDLPVLEGQVHVGTFELFKGPDGEPDVRFDGYIDGVSLEKLTKALDWAPLSGNLSGSIPGVSLSAGSVSLDGQLKIRVFDGEILIQSLSMTDVFNDLPTLSADLEIVNLDLNALTEKFSFGNIEGRLDGRIRGLYLENWRPLAFNAWFATPPDDNSRHRISQKAVESISSIGGGGTANILSRTFLRLFDSFGYERLGLGCRLQGGVCELSGVEPVNDGYYIVKGGGVPRIDVIGYNRRVDWNVLVQRLKRITASKTAVVQ
ncbi:MAG: hypothetical protein ABFS02_10030 [Pseudomonadota bacterium]